MDSQANEHIDQPTPQEPESPSVKWKPAFSKKFFSFFSLAVLFLAGLTTMVLVAQKAQNYQSSAAGSVKYIIYDDRLASGWLEWSNASVETNISKPVYSGSRAISYRARRTRSMFYVHSRHAINTSQYSVLHFAAKANQNSQKYVVYFEDKEENTLGDPVPLANYGGDPVTNQWKVYEIPLVALHAANTSITGLVIKGDGATGQPTTLYLDEIEMRGFATDTHNPTPTTGPTALPSAIPTVRPTTPAGVSLTPTRIPTPTPIVTIPPISNGSWWKPTADRPLQLHWQLSTDFNPATDFVPGATVYDFDGEHATAADVQAVHSKGYIAICYIDVGVFETYRSDASKIPGKLPNGTRDNIPYDGDPQYANVDVIGGKDGNWDGSYWLDISRLDILGPVMKERIQMCKNKGFDAVEPDEQNVEGNKQEAGFPITVTQQLAYNKWLSDTAHSLGLSIGLKGDVEHAAASVQWYDWDLTEECYQYSECNLLSPFKAANKATWIVEYAANPNCTDANKNHYNAIKRDLDLVGPKDNGYFRSSCTPDGSTSWPQ